MFFYKNFKVLMHFILVPDNCFKSLRCPLYMTLAPLHKRSIQESFEFCNLTKDFSIKFIISYENNSFQQINPRNSSILFLPYSSSFFSFVRVSLREMVYPVIYYLKTSFAFHYILKPQVALLQDTFLNFVHKSTPIQFLLHDYDF